jgi:hypothetical protein
VQGLLDKKAGRRCNEDVIYVPTFVIHFFVLVKYGIYRKFPEFRILKEKAIQDFPHYPLLKG